MLHEGKPLATYHEVRFDEKRIVDLFADTVRVRGSSLFGTDFDTKIALRQIQPRVTTLRTRNRGWLGGLAMTLTGLLGYLILVVQFGLKPWSLTPVLLGGLGVSGLLLLLVTMRKIEFAQFQSHAGVPVLDIARSGPDSGVFDEFVEQVLRQVRTDTGSEA